MAHVAIAALVTVHVLLYKRNVAASVSWIGIAWLSPFLGALLYVTMGINRVKRRAQRLRRQRLSMDDRRGDAGRRRSQGPADAARVGDRLADRPDQRTRQQDRGPAQRRPGLSAHAGGDQRGGEERRPVASHIFRADKAGEAFHQALIQAQRRGVEVRVLIDGVGGGYFWSGTYNHLHNGRRARSRASCIRIFPGACPS